MDVAPSSAVAVQARDGPYHLRPFEKLMAPVVAGWVRTADELFKLAPKTPPPLTTAKVVEWPGVNGCPLLFARQDAAEPLGYLEINPMPTEPRHFWLGHCVVDPQHRGKGLGRLMVDLALDQAFRHRRAARLSLVVFPDNVPALRCYRRVGFVDVGQQIKHFHTTGQQHQMLRMTIDKKHYARLRRQTNAASS